MQRNPEIAELAERVACWLPAYRFDSRVTDEYQDATLLGDGGRRLTMRRSWRNAKMATISGNAGRHSINCSLSRKPQDIAADITRRLLPQFETDYTEKAERDAERDELEARLEVIRQGFERLGLERLRHSNRNVLGRACVSVEVRQYNDGECRLEITASPDDAMRLVGLLNTINAEKSL